MAGWVAANPAWRLSGHSAPGGLLPMSLRRACSVGFRGASGVNLGRAGFRRFVFQRFGRRDAGVRAERGQAGRGETRMKAGRYSGRRGMRGKLPQGYVFSASAPVFVGEFVIFAKNKA